MIELDLLFAALMAVVMLGLVLTLIRRAEERAMRRRAEREATAQVYRRPDGSFLVRSTTLALTCNDYAEAQAVRDWANDPDDVRSLDMVRLPWSHRA